MQLRRPLTKAAQGAFEALWCAAFRGIGSARRGATQELAFAGGASVLVVAPHPDDEVAGCGGTLLRHALAGDRVTAVYATDGRRSRALGLAPDRMAEVRREEAAAAAAILGVERVVWLGLPEGEWQDRYLEEQLAGVLGELTPAIVYAPSRVDFHPEHRAVAHALARALAARPPDAVAWHDTHLAAGGCPQGDLPVLRMFQVQVPLGAPLVNRCTDISSVAVAHDAAIAAHASQRGSLAPCRRMKRYAARVHGGASLAEEFREVSARDYVALHAQPPPTWTEHFRGLRYFAAGDPLAYAIGRGARRRLAGAGRPLAG